MNRKIASTIIISILLTILLSSCNALLNPSSFFSALDKPDTGALSKMTGTKLLDALADQHGSKTFYEELSDSEAGRIDAELERLQQSGDESVRSKAALAQVELTVMTNPVVRDTINSIADLLIPDDHVVMDTAAIVGKLTTALDPIKNDPAALAEFLRDMSKISESYGKVSTGTVGPGDMQTFMVAAVFATIVDVYPGDMDTATVALSAFLVNPNAPLESTLLPVSVDVQAFQAKITGAAGKVLTLTTLAHLAGLETLADTITDALTGK